jgi:hypothetical protein
MNRPNTSTDTKAIVRIGKGGPLAVWTGGHTALTTRGKVELTPEDMAALVMVTNDVPSVEVLHLGLLDIDKLSSQAFVALGFARGDGHPRIGGLLSPGEDGRHVVLWPDGSTSTMSKGGKFTDPALGRWRVITHDASTVRAWSIGSSAVASARDLAAELAALSGPSVAAEVTDDDDAILATFGVTRPASVTPDPAYDWEHAPTTVDPRPHIGAGIDWTTPASAPAAATIEREARDARAANVTAGLLIGAVLALTTITLTTAAYLAVAA